MFKGYVLTMSRYCYWVYMIDLFIAPLSVFILFILLGLNVALTHQNRSYRDSETKENVEE